MKKNTGILLLIGFFILLFTPTKVFASTKQITCFYRYKNDVFGLNKVIFSYTIYDDKAVFNGFGGCKKSGQTNCVLENDSFIFVSGIEQDIHKKSYNRVSNTYSCPELAYVQNGTNYQIGIHNLDDNTALPLTVSPLSHTSNVNVHKPICDYTLGVKGVGAKNNRLRITFYYEAPSIYSIGFDKQDGSKEYVTEASNGSQTAILSGRQITMSYSLLKKLFGDFNPDEEYKKCNEKEFYVNDYTNYIKIEAKKNGSTSASKPGRPGGSSIPNDQDYQPIVDADCKSLLGDELTGYLKQALSIIQIAGVIFAIILGMGDFINALLSGKSDDNGKAGHKFITRVIMAALLLLVPALLKFIINTFGLTEYGNSFCVI